MSGQHHDFPKTTVKQFVLATLGGLVAPALVIFLLAKMVMAIQATHVGGADPAKVEERIKPVAEVNVSDNSGPHVDRAGDVVVKEICAACHATGALGAPKAGDSSSWAPRLSQGYETLLKHAIEGIRQMPARGGSPDLTDTEVAAAMVYMANQSGASFKAPRPATPAGKPAAPATTPAAGK